MSVRRAFFAGALALLGYSPVSQAYVFDFDVFGTNVEAVTNTTFIGGVAFRTEKPEERMIAKGHLDPEVCGREANGNLYYQSCQGLFRDQIFPSERIANAPGFSNSNYDQGNLNYDQGDVTQGGIRINQDLLLQWGDFGFFFKGILFYDPFNDDFDEFHPSYITADNVDQVGYVSMIGNELLPTPAPVLGVRSDGRPCPANRNPAGLPCGLVYGPGGRESIRRTDKQTRRLAGLGFILQDLNIFGTFELPGEIDLLVRLGRQQINWGEATIEFFDSLNIANPPDLQNLFRLGGNGLDDFYQPVNMISMSTSVSENIAISGFYQLEFLPLVVPAAGTFYSPVNIGTSNDGPNYLTTGFGQLAHDPDGLGRQLDSPLTAITNTTSRIPRLKDREADWEGQFGISLKYYAENFNNGTEFGFYFANYHSRLPIASFNSISRSCAKDAVTSAQFATDCPNWPVFAAASNPNNPEAYGPDETGDALSLDSIAAFLEYPENIQMFGLSANTSFGLVSAQAEVAYRPNQPLQVALIDLVFAAYGPSLSNCHIPGTGCQGSTGGAGVQPDGSIGQYGSSNFVGVDGVLGSFPDTLDAIVGAIPGSGRSFPSFVIPYRGGVIGDNPGSSYIQGWEEFETYTFDIGLTYVEGNTDLTASLIGADQVIYLFEIGGVYVPNLPDLDVLQLEAPGIEWHASAGADGTGADGSRQACSTNVACHVGPDGLRFNPHQQDLGLFPDDFSAGYSLVALIRYESVLPKISIQPQIIFKHDVYNTTPGLASNYIEGRILWDTGIEVRYGNFTSFNFGYRAVAGGGVANNLGDRDEARFFVKYAF